MVRRRSRAVPATGSPARSSTPPSNCSSTPVTIRRCRSGRSQARVGVTPPSIYLHFADKQELLDAVVTLLRTSTACLVAACENVDDPPRAVGADGRIRRAVRCRRSGSVQVARCTRTPRNHSPKGDELTASAPFVQLQGGPLGTRGQRSDAGSSKFWAAARHRVVDDLVVPIWGGMTI